MEKLYSGSPQDLLSLHIYKVLNRVLFPGEFVLPFSCASPTATLKFRTFGNRNAVLC